MDFERSPEQQMLRDSVERFLHQNYDFESRRRWASSDLGYSENNWKAFAELGWLSIPFAEENEGFGGTMVDIVITSPRLSVRRW